MGREGAGPRRAYGIAAAAAPHAYSRGKVYRFLRNDFRVRVKSNDPFKHSLTIALQPIFSMAESARIYFTNSTPGDRDSASEQRTTPRQTWKKPVRKSTIVMIAFAVVFGLLAVFVAQSWLDSADRECA